MQCQKGNTWEFFVASGKLRFVPEAFSDCGFILASDLEG